MTTYIHSFPVPRIFFLIFVLGFCSSPLTASDYDRVTVDKPDMVVGIVVDKMRYDYLSRMWDVFDEGGFKRLFNEGSSFSNARYDFLVNQSSAGYATIFTGANPSAHGIIADHWFNRLGTEIRSGVYDENYVAVGGSFDLGKRSPAALLTATIGDELRMANDFRSRVFSVSMNDAAAILSGGFSANAAWWFDPVNGSWMTSSYYLDSLPSWVMDFDSLMLPDTYLDRSWEPLYDYSYYFGAENDSADLLPFSYDLKRLSRERGNYEIMFDVPQGNTLTKDFALSLIQNEQLGKGNSTDMLIIGFSATSNIDNKYGTFSKELQDAYLRLDREIEHLLNYFDDNFGKSNVLVYLTSDQSVAYPYSYNQQARIPVGTFSPAMAMALLRSYLNITYGREDLVSAYNAGMVYLDHNLIEDNNIPLHEIQNRSSRFLNQFSGVAGTVTEDVLRRNFFSDGIPSMIQAGFHPKRSGDIMIYLQQGWYERGFSDNRLTLTSYDQHVPLVFYGWNMESMNIGRPVSVSDIAPTISIMLNIPLPHFSTGSPITEILR
ncbi:MAG: alkaline phosphatase family protein [Bacteroidales bacterium]